MGEEMSEEVEEIIMKRITPYPIYWDELYRICGKPIEREFNNSLNDLVDKKRIIGEAVQHPILSGLTTRFWVSV